jgi:peptide/nickel transport system permease protein
MTKKLKLFFQSQREVFKGDWLGTIGIVVFICFVLIAIFASFIAPYGPEEMVYSDGRLVRLHPPCWRHPFGTTQMGKDIFSQVIYGSRAAILVGILSAVLVSIIGTTVGLVSGYYGGRIDALLMRIVDLAYGIPFLPFIIILVALTGLTFWNVVFGIGLLLWRTPARVIRAQVLSLRNRPFVEASRVLGASNFRIIFLHIAPNVLPLTFSYTALTMGWAILTEANLSFLGYGDPLMISWGKILFGVYIIQAMTVAWWWVLAPGLAIILLVLSGFFIGRAYEKTTNPKLREF